MRVNWSTPGFDTGAFHPKGAAGFAIIREESSPVNTGQSWAKRGRERFAMTSSEYTDPVEPEPIIYPDIIKF